MNSTVKVIVAASLAACLATTAHANPELFVTYEGVSGGGNNQWLVAVAPDPDFFAETTSGFGSSLATELAFAVEGSSIVNGSIDVNTIDWPFDNPGNNPFTNDVTFGMWLSGALDTAFGSFGSNVFLSGAPVPLFSFETVGTDLTTVHYGVAASGHPTKGSIIAQTGQNFPVELTAGGGELALALLEGGAASNGEDFRAFTGYTGSVASVPEPSTLVLALGLALFGSCVANRNRG